VLRIGNVETSDRVALVAEIGNNHEGSVALAEELIGLAHEAGADAVKLQTLVPELFVSRADPERLALMRRFALPLDETQRLIKEAEAFGIHVFSTPLDLVSAQSLGEVASTFKISSGDLTFTGLLESVAKLGKDTILSTGASYLTEVESAVGCVLGVWNALDLRPDLALLHCVSAYPTAPSSVNLRAMHTLKSHFPGVSVGFSDHTIGIDAAVAAVAAGAVIVEKHFTIHKNYSSFRDHALSADPRDLRELKNRMDDTVELLGSVEKLPNFAELESRISIRRSVSAAIDIAKGHLIERDDLVCMRPGSGIPPKDLDSIIGRTTRRAFAAGQTLDPTGLS
jgi:N,N'-diacetyllegionaminate synthase